MSKHTISEAARLVGKHRSTIQKHIREGKLSKFVDSEGNPFIDTSELLRVYDGLVTSGEVGSSIADEDLQVSTPNSTHKIAELEAKLELEKVKREKAEALLRKTEESEAGWKELADRLSLLLTDQRSAAAKQEKNQTAAYQKFMRKLTR